MFWSRNSFFKQQSNILKNAHDNMVVLLNIKGRSLNDISEYSKAFHYFVKNPNEFDGATIVKDLVDVRTEGGYLDADAMLHDYEYIYGSNSNFKKKWSSDWKYLKFMELNGKGIRVIRFLVLTIAGLILVPYNTYMKR